MATFICRVQFLDDTDPFNSTNFPEPTRPPLYTFRRDIPLINQIVGVHRLLKAPHKPDDCALQLSHNGSYLDLESTLAEQRDDLEGFQEEGGRGKKHSIILRTQLSVRVHACIVLLGLLVSLINVRELTELSETQLIELLVTVTSADQDSPRHLGSCYRGYQRLHPCSLPKPLSDPGRLLQWSSHFCGPNTRVPRRQLRA
uniref:FH1/FH2 domain-containing protein 3 n=1 Tax=Monopterus albus TaxID=43700 RepID=UPI0009B2FD65|nr:FH1/FH2 domain-containing protein 3-like [Monopterus albus]